MIIIRAQPMIATLQTDALTILSVAKTITDVPRIFASSVYANMNPLIVTTATNVPMTPARTTTVSILKKDVPMAWCVLQMAATRVPAVYSLRWQTAVPQMHNATTKMTVLLMHALQ